MIVDYDNQEIISTHSLTKRLTSANYVWGAYLYISTHSLTKRLTLKSFGIEIPEDISTHSLTKRLTDPGILLGKGVAFQLTASRRG